jgi:restriction endonuclease S subunit
VPEYVYWYTKTQRYAEWVHKLQRPSGQPNINKEEYKSLEIILPSRNEQMRLISDITIASKQRASKLREADELLVGVDGFVRKTIGLPEEVKMHLKFFAIKISDKKIERIDPEFHNPFYQHRIKRIKEMTHDTLGNIIEFSSETWNQSSDFTDTFPYIEISGVGLKANDYEITQTLVAEAPSRAKMIVRDKDIIVSTTRPHRGAIATINCDEGYYIASTGFCVLRKMKREDVSREYLQWILLNDYVLQQFLQRSSGGNYPAITQDEIKKVVIPIPDKAIQDKIVEEAVLRKNTARKLTHEAETEWTAAKERFERELLGVAK